MVAENAEPLLPIKAKTLVHVLVNLLPLSGRIVRLVGRRTTLCRVAAPVKVVADIQDVVRLTELSLVGHGLRYILLRAVVHSDDEGPMVFEQVRAMVRGDNATVLHQHASPIADGKNVMWPRVVH